MSEEFKCIFCGMPNTVLKSSIINIWKMEERDLISEFVEDLKRVADGMYFDQMMMTIEKWEEKLK